jgi:ribonuclease-3
MRRGAKSANPLKTAQRDSEGVASAASDSKPDAPPAAKSAKPAATKPVAAKPAAPKLAAPKPAAPKPVAPKPVAPKPVEPKPVEPKSAEPTPAPNTRRVGKKRIAAASALEKAIGYHFKDSDLLDRSLTHISAVSSGGRANSYQRLEFLGDHVLGLIISDMLYRSFPKGDEGELSRRLADLVRREACADVARAINLSEAIRLGSSETTAGGRHRIAILADVCEALIGAVFIDGGYEAAVALIEKLWGERMRTPVRPLRDPKTLLQEWAQARALPTPVYREVARTGPHHSPIFRIAVTLPNREPAEGVGSSKRSAEQAAAAALLDREGVRTDRVDV